VNAATREKDFKWLLSQEIKGVSIQDLSAEFAQLAIQGPRAEEIVQPLTDSDLGSISFYWFAKGEVAGAPAIISRTGYTGEPGFELYVHPSRAEDVWLALFAAGKKFDLMAAGLAARNSLRLEMKYALYGNDIDENRTPLEAGLGWIVKLKKSNFVGRAALLAQKEEGVRSKLVGFEMADPGIVRDGYAAFLDGKPVGQVTSGGFSPTLSKSIGLVYLPSGKSETGQALEIEIRGKKRAARVVKTPFLPR
jgi:aminomethyltransferase